MDRDNRGGHNRKKVNEDFFKSWSPQMAYVLGFIYADGAVEDCRESSRTCYLALANNDIDLLMDIAKVMSSKKSVQTITPRVMNIRGKKYICKTSYVIRIGNKEIYNDLLKLGLCPRKSLIIKLPKIPGEYFQHFLRGYFDGDGCINVEKTKINRINLIFTSGSKLFLEQLTARILEFFPDIKCSLSCGFGAFRLRYNWRNALMVADFMYRDVVSAPYLKYKYEKYMEYLKLNPPKDYKL